jgi:hypothetical protein
MGVAKMRFSWSNDHSSCNHWLKAWIATWVRSGSSRIRSSRRLASVGNMSAFWMPSSSRCASRLTGSRAHSGQRMGLPKISRNERPSGFPTRKYSSCAPGGATTSKVGLGMYSVIRPLMAILVRPSTCT